MWVWNQNPSRIKHQNCGWLDTRKTLNKWQFSQQMVGFRSPTWPASCGSKGWQVFGDMQLNAEQQYFGQLSGALSGERGTSRAGQKITNTTSHLCLCVCLCLCLYQYQYLSLSLYLSISLSLYLSISLSLYLSLSISLSLNPSIPLSLYPSIPLSIYPSIDRSIYPSIHLSIYPSIHLSICLSVYLI